MLRQTSIDEKLRILQPVIGAQRVKQLRMMYLFEDDFRQKKDIENYIDILLSKHAKPTTEDRIILPPPEYHACQGNIHIGKIEYLDKTLYPFALNLKDINRHVGIFGSTGSGKTTFALNLIRQLNAKGIPFMVFDWEKSYRALVREFDDVEVLTVGRNINPLFLNFLTVPPGIMFDEYIKSVIAIISEDYIGGIGADTMLLKYMEQAYMETQNPFFEDLCFIINREISKDKGKGGRLAGRSGLWKESVMRQVAFMGKGGAGLTIGTRKHYPLEKLFSRPIVLEFGNLKSPYDRKFFIHIILNWLSIYVAHRGIESEKLNQVLIFEEFHNITNRGKSDDMVSGLFRESRKYGIGLVAIDQTPSEIPNSIFANMNVKASFALTTQRDIQSMAKAVNLESWKSKYLGMLDTGQCIVNVKQRCHEPFLLKAPFVPQKANMTDDELKDAMRKFSRKRFADFHEFAKPGTFQSPQNTYISPPPALTPLEKIVLAGIIDKPLDGVDKRTKKLGFHPSQMVDIHASLASKGFIQSVYIDRNKLFDVTDAGKEAAEKAKIPIPKQRTRGGLEHYYWIHKIYMFLRDIGFIPQLEHQNIDIACLKNSLAIEVETGKSDIKANIEKLQNSRFIHRYMLTTSKEAEFKIKKIPHHSIKVMFIRDFFKLTNKCEICC